MLGNDYLSLQLVNLKPGDEWAAEGSEQLAFVFLKGGTGAYRSPTGNHSVMPGDVLAFDSTIGGKLSANGGTVSFAWFSACAEHLFPLFATHELSRIQEISNALKSPKRYIASSPLSLECHKLLAEIAPPFNLNHRSRLLRVIAVILMAELETTKGTRTGFISMDEHLSQVFEKLSLEDILNLSVGELAVRFSCSRRHLNRLFHQHFGFSVAALRMEMRLLKAVALLRDPNIKVINVADHCGFNHLGLFNTCFKRRFGASPGEWRKKAPTPASQSQATVIADEPCRLRVIGLCPWSDNAPFTLNSLERPGSMSKPGPGKTSRERKQHDVAARIRPDATKTTSRSSEKPGPGPTVGL